MAVRCKQ